MPGTTQRRSGPQPPPTSRPEGSGAAALDVVWNRREGRLRTGWRLLVFLGLLLAVSVAEARLRHALEGRLPDIYDGVVRALAFAAMIAAVLVLARRLLDRRPVADLGFHISRRWWTELGLGAGLGAVLMLGTLCVELAMGWVRITDTLVPSPGQPFAATILFGLVAAAAVAFGEEASFRGYPIKNLTESLGTSRWAAVAAVSIPALFFALAHVSNPGATWLSTVNTVLFGLLFGTAYLLTGELALPIGLHLAWDFLQGFGFGVVNTGAQYGSVLELAPNGASGTHWSGLPYGVEAGAMGTVTMMIGFVLLAAWTRTRPGTRSRRAPSSGHRASPARRGAADGSKGALPLRAAAVGAAVAVLPVAAPSAVAAELTLNDASHDMWVIEEGSTQPAPAPGATIGDFVRTTFRHGDRLVVIKSSFLELTRTGKRLTMWVEMRDQSGTRTTAAVRTSPGNRAGRTLLFTSHGQDIPCNVRHRVNYQRNVIRLVIPRRCLDTPRWLRFRELSEYSGRSLRFADLDDPSTTGPPSPAWTAPVRHGE
ncbi:MAG TPA: CPBP family intramembrane glutamic endopeptidase [Nocardioides sp.]|nr:CPBP family intramembrane glutamic endopeptidase [Nocardioides sp.]